MASTQQRAGSALFVAAALFGCPGTGGTPPTQTTVSAPRHEASSTPVHESGGNKLIATMGPAGGVLELGNDARVEVPRGALVEATEVTFAIGSPTTAFANREYEKAIGPTLDLAPQTGLGAPVEVSIPLSKIPEGFTSAHLTLALEVVSDQQRGYEMQGTATRWDYIQARQENGRAVARLEEIPGMRLQFLFSKPE